MVGDALGAVEGRGAKPGLGAGKRAGRLVSDPEVPPSPGGRAAGLAAGRLPCEVVGSAELSGAASFPGELCLEAELASLLAQKGQVERRKGNRDLREREQRLGERGGFMEPHYEVLRHRQSPPAEVSVCPVTPGHLRG